MARIKLISRWCWTFFDTHELPDGTTLEKAIVADYTLRPDNVLFPRNDLRPMSLGCVEFLPEQLQAALQDPRVIVLESIHSSQPNYSVVTEQMASYGLHSGMTTHDILLRMYEEMGKEVGFIPSL